MRNQRRLHARNAEKRSAGGASRAREEATDEHCGFPAPRTSRLDAAYHELETVVHKQLSIIPLLVSSGASQHGAILSCCIRAWSPANGHGAPEGDVSSKLGTMVHLLTRNQHVDCSRIRRKDVYILISQLCVAPHCRSCFSAHTCARDFSVDTALERSLPELVHALL